MRLSDGGVHDNQGITGLLEQECTVALVSDASGQTGTESSPENGRVDVLRRTNNLLQERVRWAQYSDVEARQRGGVLRGLMFVHLRKDLDAVPVAWTGNTEPPEPPDEPAEMAQREARTRTYYHVNKEVQRTLAGIRTDLDAFADEEAYALMLSGYRMVESEFPASISGFPLDERTER